MSLSFFEADYGGGFTRSLPHFYEELKQMFTIKSKVTGIEYVPKECVYIKNPQQAALYFRHIPILDITVGQDNKMCFVFDLEESRELYRLWNAHELK